MIVRNTSVHSFDYCELGKKVCNSKQHAGCLEYVSKFVLFLKKKKIILISLKTKPGLIKNYEIEEISVETKNFILHKINSLRNQIALGGFKDIHTSSNMRLVVSIL